MNRKSIASIMLFVGSTFCFFLPFVTVSCGGMKVFTLSGQQMATGTSIEDPQAFGPSKTQRIDPDPFAAVAWLSALAGVVLSLVGRRLAASVSGAAGAVSLGVMASRLEGQVQKATEGMGQTNLEIGFTFAISLLIAAAAWNIYLLRQKGGMGQSSDASEHDHSASGGASIPPPA
jgi:lysylphosphatidylglycerol synthetase-like protein (DUF2156 family)